MKLLDIDFGPVLDASGVRGFFGDGYPYYRHLKRIGLDFAGSTFVSKTASLVGKVGFLAYGPDGVTPLESFPDCIVIKFRQGVMLNAAGLGNPGIQKLLAAGRWQRREEPFFISVTPIFRGREWRLQEFVDLARIIAAHRNEFSAKFGLQINLSCANVGLDACDLMAEVTDWLDVAAHFLPGVPLMPKFSVETPPEDVLSVADSKHCHAICVSDAVRWGAIPDRLDWRGIFGRDESPLKLYGGGALSGKPLLPLVTEWIIRARTLGMTCPINAGGGLMSLDDAQALMEAGADSIFIGSVVTLRPWRVKRIIRAVRSW